MGKLTCLLFCCFGFSTAMIAQVATTTSAPRSVQEKVVDFELDNLGNLYLVNANRQVKKLNNRYDSMGVFNEVRQYGKLTSIDASNPLKVLLYYQDFATIVILDRFLDIRSTLNLRLAGIVQCGAIAQSYDNNIWVYDELANRLKKIDESGILLLESPDMRQQFDEPPQPHFIVDANKLVYAYDSARGLLLMDYFGAFKNLLPYRGWRNLHAMDKGIIATDNSGMITLAGSSALPQTQPLPAALQQAIKIRVQANRIIALMANGTVLAYDIALQ